PVTCGVAVSDSCLEAFNNLKLKHRYKYIIFKVTEDNKEIVVEKTSDDSDYEAFLKDLPKDECRYAIYEFLYEKNGKRNKILFYSWAPDAARIKSKMIFASSRSTFRKCFIGITEDIEASDYDQVSHESVL
ncbi:hypothetical protein BGZ82_006338, partial [Podila clonocystis]